MGTARRSEWGRSSARSGLPERDISALAGTWPNSAILLPVANVSRRAPATESLEYLGHDCATRRPRSYVWCHHRRPRHTLQVASQAASRHTLCGANLAESRFLPPNAPLFPAIASRARAPATAPTRSPFPFPLLRLAVNLRHSLAWGGHTRLSPQKPDQDELVPSLPHPDITAVNRRMSLPLSSHPYLSISRSSHRSALCSALRSQAWIDGDLVLAIYASLHWYPYPCRTLLLLLLLSNSHSLQTLAFLLFASRCELATIWRPRSSNSSDASSACARVVSSSTYSHSHAHARSREEEVTAQAALRCTCSSAKANWVWSLPRVTRVTRVTLLRNSLSSLNGVASEWGNDTHMPTHTHTYIHKQELFARSIGDLSRENSLSSAAAAEERTRVQVTLVRHSC